MWDRDKAIATLRANAPVNQSSLSLCAQYTRIAVEAGGVTLERHDLAKDYGPSLVAMGFIGVPTGHYTHQAGDVGIVHPIPGHPAGHMAMFDGTIWISDFRQYHGLYPGPKYRKLNLGYDIYRFGTLWDPTLPGVTPVMIHS